MTTTTSSSANIQETIHRISSNPGSFAILSSTPNWPIPPNPTPSSSSSPIHISILDSSFNPPTTAHQSIAFSTFPPPIASASSSTSKDKDDPPLYNSRLLLFSARNVEKTLKSTDATPHQRIEMMSILSSARSRTNPEEGLAVGVINEPTFVGKAAIIRRYLSTLPHLQQDQEEDTRPGRKVDLTFLVGTDTLIRFFDPRFYPPDQMDEEIHQYFNDYPEGSGAYLVSARRGKAEEDRAIESEILCRDGVKGWVDRGKVRLLGDGEGGWEEVSSTKVREAVGQGNWGKVEELVGKEVAGYIRRERLYST